MSWPEDDTEYEEFSVRLLAITGKALLVFVDDCNEKKWVPLSIINVNGTDLEMKRDAEGTLSIPQWFAKKEKWL